MAVSRILTEQEKVRNLTNTGVALPLPAAVPQGHSSPTSTIAPATGPSRVPTTRPRLTPPLQQERSRNPSTQLEDEPGHTDFVPIDLSRKEGVPYSSIQPQVKPRHMSLAVIDLLRKGEKIDAKAADLFEIEINASQKEVETLEAERFESLRKEAEAAQSSGTWGALERVASYVARTTFLLLGFSHLGTASGSLCIASCGLELFNVSMKNTGSWDWLAARFAETEEQQKQLSSRLETGTSLLSLGLGAAGIASAYRQGIFSRASAKKVTDKVSQTIGLAATGTQVTAKVGQTFAEKRRADLNARIQEITAKTTVFNQTISQDTTNISRMIQSGQTEANEVRKGISALQISLD